MINRVLWLAVLMVLFVGVKAQAAGAGEWLFSPAIYYYSSKTKGGSESTSQKIHARVGYKFGDLLYGGGIYQTEKNTSGGSTTNEWTGYGPSIGLVGKNFFGILHYLFNVETGAPGGTKLIEGTGPQIDIGYQLELNSTFGLAPQLTYRSITWKKTSGGGTTDSGLTEIYPMIALVVHF